MRLIGGYLKPWEASRYLGVPVEEIYQMLEQGELPGLMIGGQWRLPLMELEAWLDERVSPKELVKLAKHLPGVDQRKIKGFFKQATPEGNQPRKKRAKISKSKGKKEG